jgi:D-inositol-3-phosphate glycosyltransferase
MHVAVFCHNHPPHTGGVEVMLGTLTRLLARRHEVTVITTAWGAASGVRNEDGVTVHRLPALHASESWGVPWPVPTGRGLSAALAAARRADLVHAHGALYATTLLAARLSRSAGRPLVLTEHVGFVRYRRRLANAVEAAAWKLVGDRIVGRADRLTAYNSRVAEWLGRRYPGRRIHFIGNGVDSGAFRPREGERARLRRGLGLPEKELLVLFVGRQSEKKNLDFVLAAPRRGYRLVVCGARRRKLPPDVIDLGVLLHARMPELFAAVDLMINPSSGEGFPLALQEAMAAGLPVALLWDPGYEGWLDRAVPASCDTLAELGRTLEELAADPRARADLAGRERAWALARWSWEATVAAYEELYDSVLRGRKDDRG